MNMYIFVNTDLKMKPGKIASQVGHAVQLVIEDIMIDMYESNKVPEKVTKYLNWKKNCVKIVLKANAKQMYELSQHDSARYIIDDGATQVPENSLTAVAFFPGSLTKDDVKDYKLL